MGERRGLETDYLVVGAGTMGMAFVDSLIDHSDADIVMVERRHRAGGHWLDAYPFVQLHQPSMNYGVNSTPLGQDRRELEGDRDAGFYERASGTEICGYYDEIMRHRLRASGRVRFFPMCDYEGDGRFRSRLTDEITEVSVRLHVVDATYMASKVPACEPPPFDVGDGARCIPVGELAMVQEPPTGYVIIGGGKTALDALCWLLDQGTPPEVIRWIRPRDSWILNRAYFQPGAGVGFTFEGIVVELEAIAAGGTIEEIYERLEQRKVMFRTDRTVQPTMMKGGTVSLGELQQLQRIENVIRLGHVVRIQANEILLEHGSIPTSPEFLHVHCASSGLSDNPPKPIFTDDTITLQVVSRVSLSLSAALIGFVEASGRTTAEKNRICRPNPWPHTPFDWLRTIVAGIQTELGWQNAPDVQAWLDASRLNLLGYLTRDPDQAAVSELQGRFITAVFPALKRIDELATRASPAERARTYAPTTEPGD
jgi:hypothetical protein